MAAQKNQMPRGVTLIEALLLDVSPKDRERLKEYGERATDIGSFLPGDNDRGEWYFRWRFEKPFEAKLASGELVATGIRLPVSAHRPRKEIPADLWRFVFVNYDKSSISWANKEILEVEVLLADEYNQMRNTTVNSSSAHVATEYSLSEEGVLLASGDRMIFRGKKQRKLIELLLKGYRNNQLQETKRLLEQAKFSPSVTSLARAFQNNPSWQKLKHYVRKERGLVILRKLA